MDHNIGKPTRIFYLLCVSLLCASATCLAAGTPKMDQERQQFINESAAIRDDVLFGQDEDAIKDQFYDRLDAYKFAGLALRVPSRVDISRHTKAPAVLVAGQSWERAQTVQLSNNAVIVAMNIDSGEVWSGEVFHSNPDKIPMKAPAPNLNISADTSAGHPSFLQTVEIVDLRDRLELPWRSGRYAVTTFDYDWTSNTVVMELIDPKHPAKTGYSTNEAKAAVAAYTKSTTALVPAPQTTGIVLDVPPKWLTSSPELVIKGAAKIELLADWLVEPHTDPALPNAIVPVTCIAVRKDVLSPKVVTEKIPVKTDKPVRPGDQVVLHFAFDLKKHLPPYHGVGDYMVYAQIGSLLAGPFALSVTDFK